MERIDQAMNEGMHQAPATALITGGARRVGAAITRDLAANGFAVAIHCHRSVAEAQALAEEICGNGGRAVVVEGDLADRGTPDRLFAQAVELLGPIGLLVNNASIFQNDRAQLPDMALWDAHFALHVTAPVLLTRALASSLPPEAHGLAVNIIDQRVWRLRPDFFSYTLSKSALWTATQTMAQAFAPLLRVNAIGPGPTMANARQSAADFARQQAAVPLQRGPQPEEFGATIRWLWSVPSVTGQMIALDGGQHLAWQTPDVVNTKE